MEGMSARAAALGDAFTTVTNDISAFAFNPASLQSLESGHAAFSYQEGLVDDFFGHLLLGSPSRFGGLGLSVAYYNGGNIDISNGTTNESVNAQTDLAIGIGMARNIGNTSFGITGKYLSSELIERETAQAFALDFGFNRQMGSRMRIGGAIQNFGTELKYVDEGDKLPRIIRSGISFAMSPRGVPTTLLLDAPYMVNEQEWEPAIGTEVRFGVMAIRAGYKTGNDVGGFSIGTGFLMGRSTLDYSFGLAEDFNSQHRVSFSMRFGSDIQQMPALVKLAPKAEREKRSIVELPVKKDEPIAQNNRYNLGEMNREGIKRMDTRRRVYKVQNGDSLTGISKKFYGMYGMWKSIYSANKHLIDDPRNLEVGQKIIIP